MSKSDWEMLDDGNELRRLWLRTGLEWTSDLWVLWASNLSWFKSCSRHQFLSSFFSIAKNYCKHVPILIMLTD